MDAVRLWLVLLWFIEMPSMIVCQCWNLEIDKCSKHLSRFMPRANPTYYTASKLQGFCNNRGKYDSCVSRLLPYCPKDKKQKLLGLKSAYEYQCTSAYPIVVESGDCLAQTETQLAARDCDLAYQPNVNTGMVEKDCREVQGYIHCLHEVVGKLCGAETGLLVQNYTILRLQPSYEKNCALEDGYKTSAGDVPRPASLLLASFGLFVLHVQETPMRWCF